MKVKICPKCGSENKEANESCSSCYASLDNAELRESTNEPIAVPPSKPVTPRSSQPRASSTETPQSPYGPPVGSVVGPTRPVSTYRERRVPAKQGFGFGAFVFILILLAAGGGSGWWFFLRPPNPGEVVLRFTAAQASHDVEKMKSCLSQNTLNWPGFSRGLEIGAKIAAKSEVEVPSVKILTTTYLGADKSTAVVTYEPCDKSKIPAGFDARQEMLLVKEEGQWKIDMIGTLQRAIKKAFGGAVKPGSGSFRTYPPSNSGR
ncbi:MAG: hypothetical protein N3B12_01100 [Armatimonadetes bacterium]|nr:hypothetical protein [Armatimonadota bacterium]